MTTQEIVERFRELEVEDKLALLHELWRELVEEHAIRPLTDSEKEFLDERLVQVDTDPRGDRLWSEVRAELRK